MKNLLILSFAFFLLTFMSCSKEKMDPFEADAGSFEIDNNPQVVGADITWQQESNGEGLTTNNNPTPAFKSTLEYLATESDLSMYHEVLIKTGISSLIDGDGPYTVFAPTNDAFETFLAKNNWSTIDDLSLSVLNNIARFHISQSKVTIGELSTDTSVTTMFNNFGITIHAVSSPSYLTLGLTKASFVEMDAVQTNGMVNKIDNVLSL